MQPGATTQQTTQPKTVKIYYLRQNIDNILKTQKTVKLVQNLSV